MMRGRIVPPHYIKKNETSRQPRRWVWLDTESRSEPTKRGWRQSWLMGVTAFDDFEKRNKTPKPTEWRQHDDPKSLWSYVDGCTRNKTRTVVVAHNLGYDLRVSECLAHLSALGWRLDGIRLDGGQAWAVFRRETRTLTLIDSFSWLPAGLQRIGELMGMTKPSLPKDGDDRTVWYERCRADVEILRAAYLRILRWLESEDLGNWQMTGAGTAWSAWRHRFMADPILVHMDPEAKDEERQACWTGRCEAWQWGRLRGGPFQEWDLEMAYASIAHDCEVPTKYRGRLGAVKVPRIVKFFDTHHVLARVKVTTEVPCIPTRHNNRIVWPVGTFDTVLWTPELMLALEYGTIDKIYEARVYERAPALHDWAEWVMDTARGDTPNPDPIIQMVAKHWSRALIGRFGLRYGQWQHAGTSPESTVQLIPGTDLRDGSTYRILQVGNDILTESAPVDGDNAVPSVMGLIMSECRRRLWKLAEVAGIDNVAYLDTDSLIVTREGSQRLSEASGDGLGVIIRPKGTWRRLRVLGPRQIVTDDTLRAAGVPKDAEQIADAEWRAVVWRGLSTSLGRRDPGAVHLEHRTIRLRGTDTRRNHLDGGITEPIRL